MSTKCAELTVETLKRLAGAMEDELLDQAIALNCDLPDYVLILAPEDRRRGKLATNIVDREDLIQLCLAKFDDRGDLIPDEADPAAAITEWIRRITSRLVVAAYDREASFNDYQRETLASVSHRLAAVFALHPSLTTQGTKS